MSVFSEDHEQQLELNETLKHIQVEELVPSAIAINIGSEQMPNPTADELCDPVFDAIWEVIKKWDVNVPQYYAGYCGANGSHVKLILDAVKPFVKQESKVKLPRF